MKTPLPIPTTEPTKPWYASKAIQGGNLAIAAGTACFARILGFGFPDTVISPEASEVFMATTAYIAGILAIWGRITAKKKIRT